jgi:hypothetical protein
MGRALTRKIQQGTKSMIVVFGTTSALGLGFSLLLRFTGGRPQQEAATHGRLSKIVPFSA